MLHYIERYIVNCSGCSCDEAISSGFGVTSSLITSASRLHKIDTPSLFQEFFMHVPSYKGARLPPYLLFNVSTRDRVSLIRPPLAGNGEPGES